MKKKAKKRKKCPIVGCRCFDAYPFSYNRRKREDSKPIRPGTLLTDDQGRVYRVVAKKNLIEEALRYRWP